MVNSGPFDGERTPGEHRARSRPGSRSEGRGKAGDHLPPARLAHQPPALLGHPDPDRALPGVRRGRRARGRSCRSSCPTDVDITPGGESPLAEPPRRVYGRLPDAAADRPRARPTRWTRSWTRAGTSCATARRATKAGRSGRGRRPLDAGRPVHRRRRARDPAPALLAVLHEGAVRHGAGRLHGAVPAPDEAGQVIYGGATMCKSKGNVVEPMPLVERWGADTMRLTMLFAGPFEDDIDWKLIAARPGQASGRDTRGSGRVFVGGRRGAAERDAPEPDTLVRLTHRTIKGVTDDMERFRFNTAISKLHGAHERDALGAGRGRRSPRGGRGARRRCSRRSPRSPPRSCGARCSGTGRSVHASRLAGVRPDPRRAETRHAGRPGRREGPRPDRGRRRARTRRRCRELAMASENARRAIDDREIRQVIVRAAPDQLVTR